ncbi:hypothetical protein Tco_1251818, partial [Tanacetum coccineum]
SNLQEIMKRRLLKNQEKKVVIQVMIKRKRMIVLTNTNNVNTTSGGNSTNNVNAVSLTINAAGIEVNVVDDNEDVGAEADMNNLNRFMPHLKQEEPKKVIHALKDPIWIEAMQEELLQFKLQEV